MDWIGLTGGITFNDLSISQGTNSQENDTFLTIQDSGEQLATLAGVQANTLTHFDFTII
ncbi:hypothetical protein [Coleofasciculus sp. E2-BRE-01]|uniref:hypothetical protein n=1 Tax=Coleofasciculus sp. E2-BRE-01 TaxID=3069524 RepID=UPI00330364FA